MPLAMARARWIEVGLKISGFASVFDEPDDAQDIVKRGAFRDSIIKDFNNIKMLYQHEPTQPIGRWHAIRETDRGLWVEGELASDCRAADDIAALVKFGAIDGLSIGYRAQRSERGHGQVRRYLSRIQLVEVSLVTFPLHPKARLLRLAISAR